MRRCSQAEIGALPANHWRHRNRLLASSGGEAITIVRNPINARIWPELAAVAALVLALPLLLLIPINHDAAWQMWIGRQMIHGVRLYSDIVEVNPPLWFWIAAPLAGLAELLDLPGRIVLVGFFEVMLVVSLGLVIALARDLPARQRATLYVGVLAATILLALPVFAQREHFALIAAIPWVTLIARRSTGARVSSGLALATGLVGAAAFAIKPHFALVPIALELWAWKSARRVRPETVVLVLAALAYSAAVAIWAPAYIVETLPLVIAGYGYFGSATLAGFVMPVLILGLTAAALAGREAEAPFLVAALSFFLAFLLQGKGWGYHALPALGMIVLALCVAPHGRSPWRDAAALAAAALIILPNLRLYHPDRRLVQAIDAPRGSVVAVLSASTLPLWPLVEDRGYRWPLRGFSLWSLPAIDEGAPGAAWMASRLKREVAEDLMCNPPDVLVLDGQAGFDMRGFFATEPAIGRLLADYRSDGRVGNFEILKRSRPPPPRRSGCRTIY
jgi:hypothetical protein